MPQTPSNMLNAYLTALDLILTILKRIQLDNQTAVDDMNEIDDDKENYEFINV